MQHSENQTDTPVVPIDIISDVMCPWCYIGQKHIETALAHIKHIKVDVRWRPFQLDPALPQKGKDRATYLNEKFGGEARAQEIYARIKTAGREAGINFNFDAIKFSSNTLDAHRTIRWAGGESGKVQNLLVTRLFELYFLEGENLGEHEVLADAAAQCGMDQQLILELLHSNADIQQTRDEITQANQMGVSGVPYFIIGKKYGLSGAQPPQALANAIREIHAEMQDVANFGL